MLKVGFVPGDKDGLEGSVADKELEYFIVGVSFKAEFQPHPLRIEHLFLAEGLPSQIGPHQHVDEVLNGKYWLPNKFDELLCCPQVVSPDRYEPGNGGLH